MKTIHLANSNPRSAEFENALVRMCDETFAHSHQAKRIIACGAGVVILPETDKKHDCGPSELAKALHLKEEMEKLSTTETTTTTKTFQDIVITEEDDNRNFFVKLTAEQYRLLEWLYCAGLLGSYVKYENPTIFETI